METTGVDFDTDEIITIQWQRLNGFTGEPIDELNILKRWESSEKEIVKSFLPNLKCRPFDFIFVGKNLVFDFCLLNERMKKYKLGTFDMRYLHERCILDLKPILVLMNNGKFVGYDKVLPKTNPLTNDEIPKLFKEGKKRFPEIVQYIKDEATDFIKAYQVFKKELPSLTKLL
jgi:DNA polymerase elongation subunit (family B)